MADFSSVYNVQQLKLVTEHWFDNNGGNKGCSGSGGGHRGGSGSGGDHRGSSGGHRGGSGSGDNGGDHRGVSGSGGNGGGGKGSGRGGDRCGGSYGGGGRRSSVTEKLFADYALPLGRAEVGDIVAPRVGLHKGKHRRVINIEGG